MFQEDYHKHFEELIDWFEARSYKFWHPNLGNLKVDPKTC